MKIYCLLRIMSSRVNRVDSRCRKLSYIPTAIPLPLHICALAPRTTSILDTPREIIIIDKQLPRLDRPVKLLSLVCLEHGLHLVAPAELPVEDKKTDLELRQRLVRRRFQPLLRSFFGVLGKRVVGRGELVVDRVEQTGRGRSGLVVHVEGDGFKSDVIDERERMRLCT